MMRHNGFRRHQVRVFDMADHLGGGLNAQLKGVYVHRGKGRAGNLGEQGVVEGDDRQILRNRQVHLQTQALQAGGQDVITHQNSRGAVRAF